MIFLLMSVVGNALLFVILKYYDRFNVNTLHAIVFNYFTAGGLALYFSEPGLNDYLHSNWWYAPIVLGTLFIFIFLMIAKTAQQVSVSAASVANKMSLVMPVIFAFIFFNDRAEAIRIIGIVLALVSVYLTSKGDKASDTKVNYWLPVVVFIGSGIIDTIVNYAQRELLSANETSLFVSASFFMAGINGLILISVKRQLPSWKSLVGGILLGIPNYYSIYGIMRAIETDLMETSLLYPINNILIVLLSTVLGVLLLREKPNKYNWIGILIAVVSIALMSIATM